MITIETMMSIEKGDLPEAARKINQDDILQLIEWLSLKEDAVRYQSFLLLQSRSQFFDDVYSFWNTFRDKLKSDNSYQRSLGLMLIAENVKWDSEGRMETAIDDYLELLNDEKPITIRQCIQSLDKIVTHKPGLYAKIADRLVSFDFSCVKETMRKLIWIDIINTLLSVRKVLKTDAIESFIRIALSSQILDKKFKKQIESLL